MYLISSSKKQKICKLPVLSPATRETPENDPDWQPEAMEGEWTHEVGGGVPVEPSRYFVQMLAFVCSAGGLKALPMVGKLSTIERLPNSMPPTLFQFCHETSIRVWHGKSDSDIEFISILLRNQR